MLQICNQSTVTENLTHDKNLNNTRTTVNVEFESFITGQYHRKAQGSEERSNTTLSDFNFLGSLRDVCV